jgi:hypothetical protein
MDRLRTVPLLLFVLLAVGCALPHARGRAEDGAVSAMDRSIVADAEPSDDAAIVEDTGVVIDTGVPIDTSVPIDTGVPIDTSVPIDTGVPIDTAVAPCGDIGQRCCPMEGSEGTCGTHQTCFMGRCRACGDYGQPCCAGDCRGTGNTCSNSTTPPTCTRGITSDCGGEGQICCAPGGPTPLCRSGLTCLFVCVRI